MQTMQTKHNAKLFTLMVDYVPQTNEKSLHH